MPPLSIVFVIHDEQDAVFAGWCWVMASVHRRIDYINDKIIGSCFNAKAAWVRCVGKANKCQSCKGDPVEDPPCNIVCSRKRCFLRKQSWAMA